jgi:hypothetical protein
VHLRTTNPIESTFATVRHRTKVTKGPGSRAAGLAMAFKLIESAQDRWRAVNAPHLVALVRAGATFINGKLVERPGDEARPGPKRINDLDPQALTIAPATGQLRACPRESSGRLPADFRVTSWPGATVAVRIFRCPSQRAPCAGSS